MTYNMFCIRIVKSHSSVIVCNNRRNYFVLKVNNNNIQSLGVLGREKRNNKTKEMYLQSVIIPFNENNDVVNKREKNIFSFLNF